MKRFTLIYVWLLFLVLSVVAQEKVVKLKIVQTSDVHGNYYPYNFITRQESILLYRKSAESIKRILFYSIMVISCRDNLQLITIII